MTSPVQPVVYLAPTAPIGLDVSPSSPVNLAMTTGGSAGAVSSVNGQTGAVTVTQLLSGLNGNTTTMGAGAPVKPTGQNPLAGDFYFRTDTPGTVNQRIYVCTVGGAAPTWTGIL